MSTASTFATCNAASNSCSAVRTPASQTASRSKVTRITTTIAAALPRAAGLGVGSPGLYVLVACGTDYLPTALQSYLDLPRNYADHHVVADGKTSLDLLAEQLDLLSNEIDEIVENINAADAGKLIVHGRFLAEKFGHGPLDIGDVTR